MGSAVAMLLSSILLSSTLLTVTSCTEQKSNLVEFVEDNTLSTPNDTVYSLLGIMSKMQVIADRTVLLGEIRADLTSLTAESNLKLQELANFTAGTSNPYNVMSDYYAIIQNCNYFLANADLDLVKRGVRVFEKEYAAIKGYRAWTYMQLALIYGAVPFYTEPLLTEKDADPARFPKYDINQMANFFIADLAPYIDTDFPSYGVMGPFDSRKFYIPIRLLLGDFCLWSGRYREAAQYYHDYLIKKNDTHPTGLTSAQWRDEHFESCTRIPASIYNSTDEVITAIPMEVEEFDGTISYLDDVFESTDDNNYYFQAGASRAYSELSRSQRYALVYTSDPVSMKRDTISPSDTIVFPNENYRGDLRLISNYTTATLISSSNNYSTLYQEFAKCTYDFVTIYRLQTVYLRYAEALNRAGYPEAAFFVLKYGLCNDYMDRYMSATERAAAGELINFSGYVFLPTNTQGIHSRGSGEANADTTYVIPELPTKADSILYVEDKICDEMALETVGEGLRFYDLMRIALRRGDPTFLARKVAGRDGSDNFNNDLFRILTDKSKWYLPY